MKFLYSDAGSGSSSSEERADSSAAVDKHVEDVELLKWNESNHECLLFNNERHTVVFLAADPTIVKRRLHPLLLSHLSQNQINIEGIGPQESNTAMMWRILSSITGVKRTPEEALELTGGDYCLTGDSLLKMLAITYRIKCGIPVVLLGECGCGKTMLAAFLCKWMGIKLISLDVHGTVFYICCQRLRYSNLAFIVLKGGTDERDIIEVFRLATDEVEKCPGSSVYG